MGVEPPLPQGNLLRRVWVDAKTGEAFAVGERGSGWSNSQPTQVKPADAVWLYGVWGSSSSNVFAVGGNGLILRWTGTAWLKMTSSTVETLHAVWGRSGLDVHAVGVNVALRYTGSGGTWSQPALPPTLTTATFNAVHGTATRLVAVGNMVAMTWDGSAWTALPGPTAILHDVWVEGDKAYATSNAGVGAHDFTTAKWSWPGPGAPFAARSLAGVSGSPVLLVGGMNGAIGRYTP